MHFDVTVDLTCGCVGESQARVGEVRTAEKIPLSRMDNPEPRAIAQRRGGAIEIAPQPDLLQQFLGERECAVQSLNFRHSGCGYRRKVVHDDDQPEPEEKPRQRTISANRGSPVVRRGGRVVYRGGLENRWAARSRGFESLPLRQAGTPLSRAGRRLRRTVAARTVSIFQRRGFDAMSTHSMKTPLLMLLVPLWIVAGVAAQSSPGKSYLELGPMVGHTSSTDTRIWAKASAPAELAITIGTVADLSDARIVKGSSLGADSDFMGHVRIDGLKPATQYFYAVMLDGAPAMVRPYPSFVTAPEPGTAGKTRVAFSSCTGRYGFMTAAIWAEMSARTKFDLLLMLGDNHYADSTAPEPQRRAYYDHRRTLGYAEITRRVPTYAIWDDHDYGPNDSDMNAAGKEISLRTFQQFWANPSYGQDDDPGVYFKFSRGDIDFFMLDNRRSEERRVG